MDSETRGKLAAMDVMISALAANLPPSNRGRFVEVLKLCAKHGRDSTLPPEFSDAYVSKIEEAIKFLEAAETDDG